MRRLNKHDSQRIEIELNGKRVSGTATSRTLLSDFIRHSLGRTGTHVGCEHGVCGACTVLIDGVAGRSCLALAVQNEGRSITTVESLAADGESLTPLQRAFRKHHALQCGYCTPGILMSFTDYLKRNPDPTEQEVREVLGGHICRCTGYTGLVRAVLEAAAEMRGATATTSGAAR